MAVRAFGLEHLALAAASVALLLHLHDKARRHLLLHHAHAAAAALGARRLLAVLGARAAALGADDVARDARLPLAAVVELLECHLDLHLRVVALAAATATAAAKKHVEGARGLVAALLVPLQTCARGASERASARERNDGRAR